MLRCYGVVDFKLLGKQSKSIPRSCQQLAIHETNESVSAVAIAHNASANYLIQSAHTRVHQQSSRPKDCSRCRHEGVRQA